MSAVTHQADAGFYSSSRCQLSLIRPMLAFTHLADVSCHSSGRYWLLYSFSLCWLSLIGLMPLFAHLAYVGCHLMGRCWANAACRYFTKLIPLAPSMAPGYKLDALPMHCRFRADPCPLS